MSLSSTQNPSLRFEEVEAPDACIHDVANSKPERRKSAQITIDEILQNLALGHTSALLFAFVGTMFFVHLL